MVFINLSRFFQCEKPLKKEFTRVKHNLLSGNSKVQRVLALKPPSFSIGENRFVATAAQITFQKQPLLDLGLGKGLTLLHVVMF